MIESTLLVVFGLALLPMLATARGASHTTVTYWVACGVILWATGVALVLGGERHAFLVISHVAGPVSACLFLLGALRFARRPYHRAIPIAGSAGALLTGLAFYGFGRAAAVAVEIAFSFTMLSCAAWVVNQHAWRSRAALPEKMLGAVLVCLAVVMPSDIVIRMYLEADEILLPIWGSLSFAIGFLTLASLTDRSARRSRRLTGELQERSRSLEVEHRTLLALVESSPLGIALADRPGRIRYLNARAAELLAIGAPEDWHGRPLLDVGDEIDARLTPDARECVARVKETRLDARKIISGIDLELDEGACVLDIMSHPVQSEDGRALGRVWMCRDVTEERRLGERLGQAQRMETVGTLAGGIAHDFNNQLTAILGNIDLLLLSLPDEDERRRAAEAVERSALHCAELTQGLLGFAQRRRVPATHVPVANVVEEVVELLRPSLPPGIEVSVAVAKDTGSLLASADDLRRVLMNLGVNARDAVGNRGEIRFSAQRLEAPEGPVVELAVADDGVGMDDATRRQIFDPFFTTKEQGKGTGLGLAVSYGIAQSHAASIEVETAPGEGTTFRLLWPAAPLASSPVVDLRPESAPESRAGATVLVGEDDPEVRRVVRGMLELAGYRVLEAANGPEVVARFDENRSDVDLLLVDLAMPGCSGLEALEQIHRQAPDRPAILMSGNPDRFLDALPAEGDLLLKPFASRTLIARVRGALGEVA